MWILEGVRMAFQTPFGDSSSRYQRHGVIPTGGMAIECGCITNATDTTFYVPTQFERCYAVVIETADGSDAIDEIPDVSSGHIRCGITGTLANGYTNYIALGW